MRQRRLPDTTTASGLDRLLVVQRGIEPQQLAGWVLGVGINPCVRTAHLRWRQTFSPWSAALRHRGVCNADCCDSSSKEDLAARTRVRRKPERNKLPAHTADRCRRRNNAVNAGRRRSEDSCFNKLLRPIANRQEGRRCCRPKLDFNEEPKYHNPEIPSPELYALHQPWNHREQARHPSPGSWDAETRLVQVCLYHFVLPATALGSGLMLASQAPSTPAS
jgi:hypothetical protein